MKWLDAACDLAALRGHLAEAKRRVKHPTAAVLVDRLAARFDADCAAYSVIR